MLSVPIIETERLRMRGHRIDDFANSAAMWGDPGIARYIGGRAFTPEEVWSRLLRYAGHWALLDFGYWLVEERSSGHFVGEVGFADYRREIQPSIDGLPELGWVLASRWHGKGYATESVRAVIEWGAERFGSMRTVCLIHPENAPSIRVAEKCGFIEFQRTTYKGEATILYSR